MKTEPKITHRHKTVDYTDIKPREAFIYDGDLFVKVAYEDEQLAFCLNANFYLDDSFDTRDTQVIPVNSKIVWSYLKAKGAKK